jgi:hypothetical protein
MPDPPDNVREIAVRFACDCGHLIRDRTNHLPQRASPLRDGDDERFWGGVYNPAVRLVTALASGHSRARRVYATASLLWTLPILGCRDTASAPLVSRTPLDICAGKTIVLDLRLTVREASAASGLVPSMVLPVRLTFRPDAASAGADPSKCLVSGTVTTADPLPLSAPNGTGQPVTFRAAMEDTFGGVGPVAHIEQGDITSQTSPSSFRGILLIDIASGPWSANGGAGRSARGDFNTY